MLLNVDAPPAVRPLGFDATLHFARRLERVAWAPNVVAVIEGSDPVLKHEYVVVTAHLDGLGQARGAPPGPGSVLNGADDNASGVAAMVYTARALAAQRTPPRRSVLVVAVSGEERGLWGSDAFTASPPVP
ncbi:MAG: M20/M25/M40 family metallo-hydrolase [Gemmatimonadetes bacterium]|nr:M20/M25/M40 family metallo-hydrolase [Gemmatimonadota bacterium]